MENDLFNGVELFFNTLKEKCASDEEYAAEILKARGFLLEDAGLILSDNSHEDDAAYLNELLTADNLGEVKGNKIFISLGGNVEKIFYSDNISSCEAFSPGESWGIFLHNSHAPKVPLRILEPFVGRYIKAISACGVQTHGSCDGNHPARGNLQRIHIDISCEPNILWHSIICQRCLAEKFNLSWSNEYSTIEFNKTDKWQTYAEFNRAAEFLYNNRLKIRQIRREASDGISRKMARNLSADELAKIFSESANKLFDGFFKDV